VAGMLMNHHLAQAMADVGFYAFKRHLTYKAAWYGALVVLSDRSYPSSKTCSRCGWVDADLIFADRTFCCRHPDRPDCGLVLDRDLTRGAQFAHPRHPRWEVLGAAKRLWRGERWRRPGGRSEPLLGEAGTKHVRSPGGIKR